MIYFDNAASSFFKPKIVKDRVIEAMEKYNANSGRGSHSMAISTASQISTVRSSVSKLFGAGYLRVIFTHNCTTALNITLLGLIRKGDHIITTDMEHNSVLRPLHKLHKRGLIDLSIVKMNEDGIVTSAMIESSIRDDTRAVVVTHTSNVTGATNPIREIGRLCHDKGICFVVDGAQGVGHADINIVDDYIDVLCIAGHKGLFSLQSVGAIILSDDVELTPVLLGGTGIDSIHLDQAAVYPENFESGTLSAPLIISLGAGIEYYTKNQQLIHTEQRRMTQYLLVKIMKLKHIKLYSNMSNCNSVISFNVDKVDCNTVGRILDEKYGICTRTGIHCAPLIHEHLGTAAIGGCVRVSLCHKNTVSEIDVLLSALSEMSYLSQTE